MERKITEELRRWRSDPDRKSLIVTGCRRSGKTHAVMEFAESEYSCRICINFMTDPEKRALFEGSLDLEELRRAISMCSGTPIRDGETVLVLDEVQRCPGAYSALKHLCGDRRIDVIALEPSLGIDPDAGDGHLSPMGYVSILAMHPMDFEEYLWAMGVSKDAVGIVKRRIRNGEPVDSYFHVLMTRHFRRYLVVGGMPEAVKAYAETGDYARAALAHDRILEALLEDAGRFSGKAGRRKIDACLRSVPRQLSREGKRFRFSDIEGIEGSGSRMYGDAIDQLIESGTVLRCLNVAEPSLQMRTAPGSFKLYMSDTGLLTRLMEGLDPSRAAANDPFIMNGALMENAIAAALAEKGHPLRFYAKRNSTLEIDFLLVTGPRLCLVDLKTARNGRSRALNALLDRKDPGMAGFKVMDSNVEMDENGALHLPLYAVSFFEGPPEPEIPPAPSAEEMNEMFRRFKEAGMERASRSETPSRPHVSGQQGAGREGDEGRGITHDP